MVPAGEITDKTIAALAEVLEPGDTIIDGGNTHYHDDIRHANELREKGIHHVDFGTSGGVWGFERGFCLMIGGEDEIVDRLGPIFASIAPGVDSAPRTPGRTGDPTPSEQGYLHCGAERRRPLREDGAQRDRVRPDGRLRRGPQHHQGRQRRQADGGAGRRDEPARASRVLPVRHRHDRGRRGVAARQRGRLVAARPHGAGAVRVARPRRVLRPRVRLRRGPLDVDRRDRGRRARAGAHRRAVLALQLARARRRSPTRRSRRCASSSAGTTRSPPA